MISCSLIYSKQFIYTNNNILGIVLCRNKILSFLYKSNLSTSHLLKNRYTCSRVHEELHEWRTEYKRRRA